MLRPGGSLQKICIAAPTVQHAVDAHLPGQHFVENKMLTLNQYSIPQVTETVIAGHRAAPGIELERLDGVEEFVDEPVGGTGTVAQDVSVNFDEIVLGSAQDPDGAEFFGHPVSRRRSRIVVTPMPRSPARTSASASSSAW